MKLAAALAVLSCTLHAQPVLTVTGPSSVSPGKATSLTFTLSGTSAANLAGIQWTITPQNGLTFGTPNASEQATAAGKGIYCSATTGICVFITPANAAPTVLTNSTLTDGVVATLPVTFTSAPSGTVSFPLTGLIAVSSAGSSTPINPGTPYSITVTSNCDYNGDGVVNYLDISAMISAIIGQTTCSASFAAGCSLTSVEAVIQAALGSSCSL
jgi:hypothetical protein